MMKMSSQRLTEVIAVSFCFLLLVAFAGPQSVSACSCLAGQSQGDAFAEADAVFSGKVLSVTSAGDDSVVTFDTGVVWKGLNNPRYSVVTADNSAACGYTFQESEWYVVYASADELGELATGLCSRTALLDESEDLLALGMGVNPDGTVVVDDESGFDIWEWLDTFAIFIGIFIGSIIFNKYVYPKMKEKQEMKKRK